MSKEKNNTISGSSVEAMVMKRMKMPALSETSQVITGPRISRIRMRTVILYLAACLIGVIPYLLALAGNDIPVKLQAVFMGLLIPGGGCISTGHIWHMLSGLSVWFLFFKAGFYTMDKAGDISVCLILWAAGALGGLGAAEDHPLPFYGPLAVVLLSCLTWLYWNIHTMKICRNIRELRKKREQTLPEAMERLDAIYYGAAKTAEQRRELTGDAVKAAQYIYDIALSEDPIKLMDKLAFPSLAHYRYQISYLCYGIMMLQCRYTPNFHGYQKEALGRLIECYCRAETTAYWKWESLGGYLRWNPDPVKKANVMLSGWMAPAVVAYGANFGDSHYEQDGALKFKPFYHRDKSYDHSVKDLIAALSDQYYSEPLHFIPCEPNMMFPVCNSYAIAGMMMYDRQHNTGYTERVYDKIHDSIYYEFIEMSGDMAIRRNQLTGLRFTPKGMMPGALGNIAIAQPFSPVDPGVARRAYSIIRDEALSIDGDGIAQIAGMDWESMIDMGTLQRNPGLFIAMMEITALEFGDYEMAAAFRAAEEKFLILSKKRFKYSGSSVCAMAMLAATRWAQRNDWFDTIHKGPAETAATGPVLTGCSYPEVLVAVAVSSGDDLALVLYNGTQTKENMITVERLKPLRRYIIEGTGVSFAADEKGRAEIAVVLDGRTEIHIRPVEV